MNEQEWRAFKDEFPEVYEQSRFYPQFKRGMKVNVDVARYNEYLRRVTMGAYFSSDSNPVEIRYFNPPTQYDSERVTIWSESRNFLTSLPTNFLEWK